MGFPAEMRFSDEADFTTRFIIPLLQRLGFSLVLNFHGTVEFGKDLIFADTNRFGHTRYHGLQAKYVANLSLGDATSLIDDCKQAFESDFLHPHTGTRERINSFYAVNGGSISDQARERFFQAIRCPFGGSVTLLDGKSLLALDNAATYARQEMLKERLSALVREVRYNRRLAQLIQESFITYEAGRQYPAGFRLRLDAVSDFLRCPPLSDAEITGAMEGYWHNASVFNCFLDFISRSIGKALVEQQSDNLRGWVGLIEKDGLLLETRISTILCELGIPEPIRSSIESYVIHND